MELNFFYRYRYALWGIGVALIVVIIAAGWIVHKQRGHEAQNSPTASMTVKAADLSIAPQSEAKNQPLAVPKETTPAVVEQAVEQQPLVSGCSLHFSFAPTAQAVAPGGQINYSIVLANLGEDTCQNASFSIYYADNESFVSSSEKSTSDNYYWDVGDLTSRQTYQLTLSTQEDATSQETQVSNQACATADNGSDVCPTNLIFVQAGAPAMPAVGAVTGEGALYSAASAASVPAPVVSAPSGGIWGAAFDVKQFGLWIWDSPIVMTPSYETAAIVAAKANGFNTLYVTVDDYLPISRLPAGASEAAQQSAYFAATNAFVSQARANGIQVYAEAGSNNWGDVANRWQGTALVNFVQQYNATYPSAPISGVQLDVESYLEPDYNSDPSDALEGYLNLIADVADAMQDMPNIKLSIVIPHFYDDQIQWTPPIPFGGTTTYTYNHLLDILQTKPGSDMIVMAYRNSVSGTNGSEALAQTEMQEAEGTATHVLVAQETGNVQPSYVTFYGLSKQSLYNSLLALMSYFGSYSSYGGLAVDYIDPFLALKN